MPPEAETLTVYIKIVMLTSWSCWDISTSVLASRHYGMKDLSSGLHIRRYTVRAAEPQGAGKPLYHKPQWGLNLAAPRIIICYP
jgi:hypothetical protein